MGRHSKQAHTREFFTSGEREKAMQEYGTQKQRLGADSQRRFDECQLCTSRLIDPVATPYGSIYCRECILTNLLTQKSALDEQKRAHEESLASIQAAAAASEAAAAASKLEAFARQETGVSGSGNNSGSGSSISHQKLSSSSSAGAVGLASPMAGGSVLSASSSAAAAAANESRSDAASAVGSVYAPKPKIDPRERSQKVEEVKRTAFWVPQSEGAGATTNSRSGSAAAAVPAPDPAPRDPATGGFLRAKQLVSLRLTPNNVISTSSSSGSSSSASAAADDESDVGAGVSGGTRFQCPGCSKPIVYQQVYALKNCGHVVCATCLTKLVAPSKACMTCSVPAATKADVIKLQQGGSAFAANSGTIAEAKGYIPTVF